MYNDWFFEEEGAVAKRSAEIVIPWVLARLGPDAYHVVDVGCGTGEWLMAAKAAGCKVFGIDAHVPEGQLLLGKREFCRFELKGDDGLACFGADLAICVEVAEHLPPETAHGLVDGLAFAEAVLFSAATPGQPGIGHINCRPHEYWHDLFAEHGKTPEFIGDKFDEPVADFYRRNMFLYR